MPTNIRMEYNLNLHLHLRRCRTTRIKTAPSCSGPLKPPSGPSECVYGTIPPQSDQP